MSAVAGKAEVKMHVADAEFESDAMRQHISTA
jgi:hypothetical protein